MPMTTDFILMVENAITRWRNHRSAARTRRIVQGLPGSIRKDIGWPDTTLPDRDRPFWR